MRRQEKSVQDLQIANQVKDKRSNEDKIFKNYLINPTKSASQAPITKVQIQGLKNVYNKLTTLFNQKNGGQQTINKEQLTKMQDQINLVCFSCKDLNHMLLTVYLMFLKNKQHDLLLQMLKEQIFEEEKKDLKSSLSKLNVILQTRSQYYLQKKVNHKYHLSQQQKKSPLMMSYIMNSNSLQINSELVFTLMSGLQRKFKGEQSQKLTQKLIETINISLESLRIESTINEISGNNKRKQNELYFLTLNNLTQEIIAIIPYSYSNQHEFQKQSQKYQTQTYYKLFLFPNYESFTVYLKSKQNFPIKQTNNILDNPQCHQKHQYSPTALITKQNSKIKTQQQQTQKELKNKANSTEDQSKIRNQNLIIKEKKDAKTFLRDMFVVVLLGVLVIMFISNHTKRLKQVLMFLDEVHGVVTPLGEELKSQVLGFVEENLSQLKSMGNKIFSSITQ